MSGNFSITRAQSAFLSFVSAEFHKRGTKLRKTQSDKIQAAKIVSEAGLQVAERHHVLTDINQLTMAMLGQRCVLKYARGWSAHGVMLLEKLSNGGFFDYLSLKIYSLVDIINHQKRVQERFAIKSPSWIVETFLCGTLAHARIPFDYKFYTFQGQVGLIIQIDRNTNPPKLTIFDGAFTPLQLDQDYQLRSVNVQPGPAIIPEHCFELVAWAQRLSQLTDAPFVSIDLYDTDQGPVFGEFTFSPGGIEKQMFVLSDELIRYLDSLFAAAESRLSSGVRDIRAAGFTDAVSNFNILLAAVGLDNIRTMTRLPDGLHSKLANIVYNGSSKAANRFVEVYQQLALTESAILRKKLYQSIADAWQQAAIKKQDAKC